MASQAPRRIVHEVSYGSSDMPQSRTICLSIIAVLFACLSRALAQDVASTDQTPQSYTLNLPVDEVVLTFHASGAEGKPVNDIKASEIRLWDNGAAPRRIVAFDVLLDRDLRVGILIDTSESMSSGLALSRAIAERYVGQVFRQRSDQAFVEDFGFTSEMQPWSNDSSLLQQSIRAARVGRMNPVGGTAIFDAVFRACFYGFRNADPAAAGNVILLFSDGEDNAGQTTVQEALQACQASNTTIYAFHVPPAAGQDSSGPKNLRDLTSGTGGRLFSADESEKGIADDLATVESETRNQYRLVYRPGALKRDGSFHEIEIQPPDRVTKIEVRPGYFAPAR